METTATVTEPLAQADGRSVSRVVMLVWLAVFVAVAVLIIDQGIKRAIVAEGEKTLKLLADIQKSAREASYGTEPAGKAAASTGGSKHSDHGVDDAAGASADSGGHAGNGLGETPGRVARPFGRPGGDG